MSRRWLECPPSVPWPDVTDTPSDVPSTFDSMSWVAKPLPAKSTSIHPPRTRRATAGPPPVWITAGPHTASTRPPRSWAARMPVGDLLHEQRLGLLRGHVGVHELEAVHALAVASGGCTRTPPWPTTTRSPARTRCIGTVRTDGAPSASTTTSPQSISGFSTGTQCPSMRTSVARLVVEWKPAGSTPSRSAGDELGVVVARPGWRRARRAARGGRRAPPRRRAVTSMRARLGVEVGAADLDVVEPVVGAGLDERGRGSSAGSASRRCGPATSIVSVAMAVSLAQSVARQRDLVGADRRLVLERARAARRRGRGRSPGSRRRPGWRAGRRGGRTARRRRGC